MLRTPTRFAGRSQFFNPVHGVGPMGFDAFIKFDGIEMEYTLSNCIVSSISTESDSGEFPVDEIALNFGGIQWRYTQQSRTGGRAVGNIATGWSLEKNCRA
jgi:hypothetical protein